MIDYANIKVKAGDGGEGAGSFIHIKGKRRGKADGGDGGSGGNVYLCATANLNTLEPFRFVKDYSAQNGQRGLSNKRKGAQGVDLEIKVPVGTQITIKANENTDFAQHLDLIKSGEKILIARSGEGGRGNTHLRDEFGRRPRSGEKGLAGEELEVTLELKLIADVGLVGMPNAGKSTLIAALTSARPKIADYPFTTLEPNLGVLDSSSFVVNGSSFNKNNEQSTINNQHVVIADIPGLIEGASQGKGLGDLFLRHIERTKILVHLIDVSAKDDLWTSYQTIRNELKAFSADLVKKKEIVVLNKIDLVDAKAVEDATNAFRQRRKKVIAISAKEKKGLEALLSKISYSLS